MILPSLMIQALMLSLLLRSTLLCVALRLSWWGFKPMPPCDAREEEPELVSKLNRGAIDRDPLRTSEAVPMT